MQETTINPQRFNVRRPDRPVSKNWLCCGVAAGCTLLMVGLIFHISVPILNPNIEYPVPLFRKWSGWTSRYMLFHPLVYGFVFAALFLLLRRRCHFPGGAVGGLLFGSGVFFVGGLPVYLLAFASFQVAGNIIALWILQCLAQYIITGMVVGVIAGRMSVDA